MKELHTWQISCQHTPEMIDRILMPIRKRGMRLTSLNYQRETETTALCTVCFEEEATIADQVYKNMVRTLDITSVEKQHSKQ
jgi:acetolactate synthase II small subunit